MPLARPPRIEALLGTPVYERCLGFVSSNLCVVCDKQVPEVIVSFLEEWGLPPICSMDCVSIAAELHLVEMKGLPAWPTTE